MSMQLIKKYIITNDIRDGQFAKFSIRIFGLIKTNIRIFFYLNKVSWERRYFNYQGFVTISEQAYD